MIDPSIAVDLLAVLKAYETWEAQLLNADVWQDSLPRFNQELYDSWMELQAKRNAVLEQVGASPLPVYEREIQPKCPGCSQQMVPQTPPVYHCHWCGYWGSQTAAPDDASVSDQDAAGLEATMMTDAKPIVWACGGGTQSVAIAVLVAEGALPRPSLIVMADTSREARETWEYKTAHLDQLLARVGLTIEVAPHTLASVDLYRDDALLVPAYSKDGRISAFCSGEWKRDVCERFCRSKGLREYVQWLGISLDERDRAKPNHRSYITNAFPLLDLGLTRQACYRIVEGAGLPRPPKSSCWLCPHRGDDQWIRLRDHYPDEWAAAVKLDESIRAVDQANGNSGVWLHKSRLPLALAPLVTEDERQPLFAERECSSGYCFV